MRVPGEGPLDAKIVLIGEAPGENEEREGRPFVGGSGQLLNQMLAAAGIARSSVYVTNVVKLRPPHNNFDVMYVDGHKRSNPSDLLRLSIKELEDEITRIKPNVIVPLGAEALRAVTGRSTIGSWRGSIMSSRFGKVVPTFHPAYILRQYGDRPIAEHDFRRVAAESVSPEIKIPPTKFILSPSYET